MRTPDGSWASRGARPVSGTQRGTILLLWALTFSMTILTLIIGYFPLFHNTVSNTAKSFDADQAFALAEAGIEKALWELRANGGANLASTPTNGWTNPPPLNTACDDEVDQGVDGLLFGMTVSSCRTFLSVPIVAGDNFQGTIGTYEVWVVNHSAPLSRIVSKGFVPSLTSPRAIQTITVDLELPPATFQYGLFSNTQVMLGANGTVFVDSYKSSSGVYNPAAPLLNGNIGTNGTDPTYDFRVLNSGVVVKGKVDTPTGGGSQVQVPMSWTPTGGYGTPNSPTLPHVTVPSSLTSLSFTTTLGVGNSAIVGESGSGDFWIKGTYTCDQPLKVRSIVVTGTLLMTDNCQLLVDSTNADGSLHSPAYGSWAGLDTNGTGSILKTGTGRTQIFLNRRGLDFDGGGLSYDTPVPAASRRPENFQVYVTCTTTPCNIPGPNNIAQGNPFYGVVYVEGGVLNIWRGSVNGVAYDSQLHGAFASTGLLAVDGVSGTSPYVHFDEDVRGLSLDGSGTKLNQIRPRSWTVR